MNTFQDSRIATAAEIFWSPRQPHPIPALHQGNLQPPSRERRQPPLLQQRRAPRHRRRPYRHTQRRAGRHHRDTLHARHRHQIRR